MGIEAPYPPSPYLPEGPETPPLQHLKHIRSRVAPTQSGAVSFWLRPHGCIIERKPSQRIMVRQADMTERTFTQLS